MASAVSVLSDLILRRVSGGWDVCEDLRPPALRSERSVSWRLASLQLRELGNDCWSWSALALRPSAPRCEEPTDLALASTSPAGVCQEPLLLPPSGVPAPDERVTYASSYCSPEYCPISPEDRPNCMPCRLRFKTARGLPPVLPSFWLASPRGSRLLRADAWRWDCAAKASTPWSPMVPLWPTRQDTHPAGIWSSAKLRVLCRLFAVACICPWLGFRGV